MSAAEAPQRHHPAAACETCSLWREQSYVPTETAPEPRYAVCGEAPGAAEAEQGRPFVGPSGRLLEAVLSHHGIERGEVTLTNVVACRPPTNRTPTKAEIACCAPRLDAELAASDVPILAVGAVAAKAITGQNVAISKLRTGPPKHVNGRVVVPTFHPAACLRAADNFPSLVTDVGKLPGVTKNATTVVKWEEPIYGEFDTPFLAARALDELIGNYNVFTVDIETAYEKDASYVRPRHHELLCVGIGYTPDRAIVLSRIVLDAEIVRSRLKTLLESKRIICHNGAFDLSGLAHIGDGRLAQDTMLMSYCADERKGQHALKHIISERYGIEDYSAEVKQYPRMTDVPPDVLHRYNAWDCVATYRLWQQFDQEVTGDLRRLNGFLIEASNALRQVEARGLAIDTDRLVELEGFYERTLAEQSAALDAWVANPRSPKQIKEAFGDAGCWVESTDKESLRWIVENEEPELQDFANKLLQYRKHHKLFSTYVKGVRKFLLDGRIYTSLPLHMTTTGRLSSRDPNLQNVPRNSPIKSMFVPSPGNIFVSADYSQLEARVVTVLAREPYLATVFKDSNRDLFGELALEIFGQDWTKAHRQMCKRVVHSSHYLARPTTVANQINQDAMDMDLPNPHVSALDATPMQQRYLARVPQVVKWQNAVRHQVLELQENLVTPWGRHRRFPLVTRDNKHDVEREAIANNPQSIASDICLTALIQLVKQGVPICLTVHDSILCDVPAADAEEVSRLMQQTMENAGRMYSNYVPFSVEVKNTNKDWSQL